MKKYFYILAALSIAPNFALAQSLDSEVDTELDQIAAQQMVAPEAKADATQRSSVNQQPIYILNQGATSASNSGALSDQGQMQAQVQKQPTTLIQASPLTESRAEQIRKARQDAEVQTEQKIVEKLEVSRMEDEKRRAAILFGDKFTQTQQQQQVQVQQVQQVQAPVVVQPAPVEIEPKENTRDIVREEIRAAMRAEDEVVETPLESRYFGAMVGIGDYPDVSNVRANYSLGAQFGTKYDSFVVEGTFQFSNYNVDSPYYTSFVPQSVEVSQYSGALAAKYEFFGGMIRPIVGGLIQYSYRSFAWANDYSGYTSNSTTATSHAIDVGTVLGTDLVFTPKFTLGMDFRYLWNLSSRVNSNGANWMTGPQYGTPIEKLSYYVLSVVGRVTF